MRAARDAEEINYVLELQGSGLLCNGQEGVQRKCAEGRLKEAPVLEPAKAKGHLIGRGQMDWGPTQLHGECLAKGELQQDCKNKINIGIFL